MAAPRAPRAWALALLLLVAAGLVGLALIVKYDEDEGSLSRVSVVGVYEESEMLSLSRHNIEVYRVPPYDLVEGKAVHICQNAILVRVNYFDSPGQVSYRLTCPGPTGWARASTYTLLVSTGSRDALAMVELP